MELMGGQLSIRQSWGVCLPCEASGPVALSADVTSSPRLTSQEGSGILYVLPGLKHFYLRAFHTVFPLHRRK